MPPQIRASLEEHFWSKVNKTDGCWLWMGRPAQAGYGRFSWRRVVRLAHRVSFELVKGPIPEGLEIDHLCGNPPCVNPEHLEAVDHQTNMARSRAARKTACAQGHPYTLENTFIRRNGSRYCRACARLNNKVQKRRFTLRAKALRAMDRSLLVELGIVPAPGQTHCKHGHEFTPENTYNGTRANGRPFRDCRACVLRRSREFWDRKRASA